MVNRTADTPQLEKLTLPPWTRDMSDGCTDSPDAGWWGVHRECCLDHDCVYYYGGTKADRRDADMVFRRCLISRGMPSPIAWLYWLGVRVGGHPRLRRDGVSWSHGGRVFMYVSP